MVIQLFWKKPAQGILSNRDYLQIPLTVQAQTWFGIEY